MDSFGLLVPVEALALSSPRPHLLDDVLGKPVEDGLGLVDLLDAAFDSADFGGVNPLWVVMVLVHQI
jgi:hypothetical protein